MELIYFPNNKALWEGFLYNEGVIESYNLKFGTYSEFYHIFTAY